MNDQTQRTQCPEKEHQDRLKAPAILEEIEGQFADCDLPDDVRLKATNAFGALKSMSDPILALEQLEHVLTWIPQMVPIWERSSHMTNPDECLAFQQDNLAKTHNLAAATEGEGIAQRVQNRTYQLESWRLLKEVQSNWRLVSSDKQPTIKLLAGGRRKLLDIRYAGPIAHGKQTRGPAGSYSKPGLERLGIEEDITPAVADLVTKEVMEGPSVEAARKRLNERNHNIGTDSMHRIYSEFVLDAVAAQQDWARTGQVPKGFEFEQGDGPILFIAQDGFMFQVYRDKPGRIPDDYERHPKHQKFTESKSFIIREIDEEGNMKEVYLGGGTLGNPDDMFAQLAMYLVDTGMDLGRYLGIVLGSDGAPWMRERIDILADLLVSLGVPPERIHKLLDWGHALGHLWDVAKLRKTWTGKEGKKWPRLKVEEAEQDELDEPDGQAEDTLKRRKRRKKKRRKQLSPWDWMKRKHKRQKKRKISKTEKLRRAWWKKVADYLWEGDISTVLAMIDELRVGSKAKEFATLKGYFINNEHRMQYKKLWQMGLPVGTGAIESAGRQTIGMRLKAGGSAFLPEIGEGMQLGRSYLKAGQWGSFSSMVINYRARRFDPQHPSCHLTHKQVRDRISIRIPMHDNDKTKRSSGIYEAQKARGLWHAPGSARISNSFPSEPVVAGVPA